MSLLKVIWYYVDNDSPFYVLFVDETSTSEGFHPAHHLPGPGYGLIGSTQLHGIHGMQSQGIIVVCQWDVIMYFM